MAEADDADDVYDPQKKNKSGSDDGDAQKPKKKPRAKKEKEPEEVHTALEGPAWTVVPPSLLYRCSTKPFVRISLQHPSNAPQIFHISADHW